MALPGHQLPRLAQHAWQQLSCTPTDEHRMLCPMRNINECHVAMWLSPRDQIAAVVASRGCSLQFISHPLQVIVSREQNTPHKRMSVILYTQSENSVCLLTITRTIHQAARGVEKSVSYSGLLAIGIMIILSWCLRLARRQKKCGAFARRMIDARQFIGVPSMQSHASPGVCLFRNRSLLTLPSP